MEYLIKRLDKNFEDAAQVLADAVNLAYPVGTELLVWCGTGEARVVVQSKAVSHRPDHVRCRFPNSKKRSRRDFHYSNVLEVISLPEQEQPHE